MKKITCTLFFCFVFLTSFGQTVFGSKTVIGSTGSGPYRIDSEFIDDDEYPDFVVASFDGGTIELYLNDGTGNFNPRVDITNSITNISDMILVDLNDDLFLDIVACGGNKLVWFENNTDGTFSSENIISNTLNDAANIAFGQIDDDLTIDLMVSSFTAGEVLWFSNDGSGNLTVGANLVDNTLNSPSTIRLKDVDNDGDVDAIICTSEAPSGSAAPNSINLFINNLVGSGTVSFTKDTDPVADNKRFVFDAAFEDIFDPTNSRFFASDFGFGETGKLFMYEDLGSGYEETQIATSLPNPATIKLLDLDDDSLDDLVVSSGSAGNTANIGWFKNNGDGSYAANTIIDNTQSTVYSFTSQDFDLDGDLDIISISYSQNQVNYFENLLETLSITNEELSSFKLYPNPVKNRLNFSPTGFGKTKITITDVTGKIVLNDKIYLNQGLDVSNLNHGVYILTVNGQSNFRFIKM